MKIVLHLGYPKTGTTWLQREVFARQPAINNLGKPYARSPSKAFSQHVAEASDEEFLSSLPRYTAYFASRMVKNRVNLFSNEGFVRATFAKIGQGHDILRTATRLRQVFEPLGEVSAFLLIRNHTDYLYSHYSQFTGAWRAFGLDEARLLPALRGEAPDQAFILDNFKYFQTIGQLRDRLGPIQLHWHFYEDFAQDNTAFVENLFRDWGQSFDRNVRIGSQRTRVTGAATPGGLWTRLFGGRSEPDDRPRLDKDFFRQNSDLIKTYYRGDMLGETDVTTRRKLVDYGYLQEETITSPGG